MNIFNMLKILCMLLLLPIYSVSAIEIAENSPPLFGEDFGVNIKTERITNRELKTIASLGIRRVRIGISWYEVEKEKGQYIWTHDIDRYTRADNYSTRINYTYDDMIKEIRAHELKIDVTLHEGNELYTDKINIAKPGEEPEWRTASPHTPDQIKAFARFAAKAVEHYQRSDNDISWHIWNEPDLDHTYCKNKFNDPSKGVCREAPATIFGQVISQSCEAIREVARHATIMGPALGATGNGDINYSFIDNMFTGAPNLLTCLDAFTVHPYRPYVPETAAKEWESSDDTKYGYPSIAEKLISHQPPPPGRVVPVAVDEWGYSIEKHDNVPDPDYPAESWRKFTGAEQAALILRMYLTKPSGTRPPNSSL